MLRRLSDPRLDRAGLLQRGLLRREEAQHDLRTLANVLERLETAGAWRVELQQQPVVVRQTREDFAGDSLVAAVREPAAARRIAAADVDGARDAADAREHQIVDFGVGDQLRAHVVAPPFERRAVVRVDVPLRVVRRIHLHVVAAEGHDLAHDVLAQERGHGAQEVFRCRIGLARILRVPEDPVPARRRDRELGSRAGVGLQKHVFVRDDAASDRERLRHERPPRLVPYVRGTAVGLLPERPPARVGRQVLEAAEWRVRNRLGTERDGDDPRAAPELAIGDDVEPCRLLERDGVAHRTVLDGAEGGGIERAFARRSSRLAQVRGPRAAQRRCHIRRT